MQSVNRNYKDKDKYLCKSDVLERGWTQTLIKQFLGQPDKIRGNPRGRYPISLYSIDRINTVEDTEDWIVANSKSLIRRQASAKGRATKYKKLREYIDNMKIDVPKLEREQLIKKACANYNAMQNYYGRSGKASPKDAEEFLDRISVNYLRHELDDYEDALDHIKGKAGKSEVYLEIKDNVLDAIAEAYPYLGKECTSQSYDAHEEHDFMYRN